MSSKGGGRPRGGVQLCQCERQGGILGAGQVDHVREPPVRHPNAVHFWSQSPNDAAARGM